MKAAISLIPEIQKQIEIQQSANISKSSLNFDGSNSSKLNPIASVSVVEKFLNDYISNMMTTLILIPDNPDQGVLYLLTGVDSFFNLVQWYAMLVSCTAVSLISRELGCNAKFQVFSILMKESYFEEIIKNLVFH